MSEPRVVFMGTPQAAVPILDALVGVADVALVVTRADKPRGRSKKLVAPPVKDRALALGLEVAQPTKAAELHELVRSTNPQVAVVAAYGRLIRPEVLATPRSGFVNVHYSLLPRWRGASPVVRAILAGDAETGVSLMKMDEGLDTGPVFAAEGLPIAATDTTASLTDRLAILGASLLTAELPRYLAGAAPLVPQDDDLATAAAKVTPEEAHVDPMRHSTEAIDRAVRAYNPSPGAWCLVDHERFKIWEARPADGYEWETGRAAPLDDKVILGTRDGAVELRVVQPPGKARMDATAWMNGRRGEPAYLF